MKHLLTISFFLISFYGLNAQLSLQSDVALGKNNVSEGIYVKNTYRVGYGISTFHLETGVRFDLISNNPNTLTGFDLSGSREFTLKEIPFQLKAYFMLNRFSDLQYETNWGIWFETLKFEHWLVALGTNFKTYTINASGREEFDIDKADKSLHENFNLTYCISAYLKPHKHIWNIGLSCTNVDYYLINQSTNPIFNIQARYQLNPKLNLFLEAWSKQAGMLNIQANFFGGFIRGGVRWEI